MSGARSSLQRVLCARRSQGAAAHVASSLPRRMSSARRPLGSVPADESVGGSTDGATRGGASTGEPPVDWEDFRTQGKQMVDFICDYYASVEQHPVRSQGRPRAEVARCPLP